MPEFCPRQGQAHAHTFSAPRTPPSSSATIRTWLQVGPSRGFIFLSLSKCLLATQKLLSLLTSCLFPPSHNRNNPNERRPQPKFFCKLLRLTVGALDDARREWMAGGGSSFVCAGEMEGGSHKPRTKSSRTLQVDMFGPNCC